MERNYQNLTWPGWENAGELGHGNFGSVYKIQRTTRGRTEYAALKVIRIPKEESEIAKLRQDDYDDESITQYYADCLNKIEDEYAMMAELKGYANIVYCDDFFSQPHEDGFGWYIYIKMELLTPLKAYLPAEIPEEQVISLGIDICNALTRCEELKIVHRDIKPENIFVSKEGKYKLGDFGIARTMEGTTGGTELVAKLLLKKFRKVSIGNLIFIIDIIILTAACFVFGIEKTLYATGALFISSKVIDRISGGSVLGRAYFIFSDKTEEIYSVISERLQRGGTFIYTKGAYYKKDGFVLLCIVFGRIEAVELKNTVYHADKKAFVVSVSVSEVFGQGFDKLKEGSSGSV